MKNFVGLLIKNFINIHIKEHIKDAVEDAMKHTEVTVNPETKDVTIRYRKDV